MSDVYLLALAAPVMVLIMGLGMAAFAKREGRRFDEARRGQQGPSRP